MLACLMLATVAVLGVIVVACEVARLSITAMRNCNEIKTELRAVEARLNVLESEVE